VNISKTVADTAKVTINA